MYYPSFASMVFKTKADWVTVLMGLRRIGKTHMLKQLIGDAIAQGVYEPDQIVLLDASYSGLTHSSIMDFVYACKSGVVDADKDWLLLLDEIQVFDDWERELKVIADHEPRIKCVVTGSSATALKKKRTETGLGRIQELILPPLLFCEYLDFCKTWPARLPQGDFDAIIGTRLEPADVAKLNQEFASYINFGAYPQIAFEYASYGGSPSLETVIEQLAANVVTAFVGREIPSLLGAEDIGLLHRLGRFIIANNTRPYSQKKCAHRMNKPAATIRKYLQFLEAAYFIRAFKKINDERQTLSHPHTHCKFILENCSVPSLTTDFFSDVLSGKGRRVEAVVLSQFSSKNVLEDYGYLSFKRKGTETEVDLCHLDIHNWPIMLTEIKWRDDDEVFQKAEDNFTHLLDKWGRKDKAAPRLYCTSESVYGERGAMRIIPAAQFSVALGVKRISYAPVYGKSP